MVRHSACRWTLAVLALGWAGPASADAIVSTGATSTGTSVFPAFATGNVETDLPASSSVTIVPGQAMTDVAQPKWMNDAGLINGYVMKDIRLSYDQKSDTLAVGVNFWGIAGNADGSPDGGTNPKTLAAGGQNPPHIGGDKSIAVALTPVTGAGVNAAPVVVAGIPADKTNTPAGTTDHFTVAAYNASGGGLTRSFGQTMAGNLGNLAYDPSKAHPGFEFTVKNFSKIPGLNALANGFYVSAYAGTGSYTTIGKSQISNFFVAPPLNAPGNLLPPTQITPPTGTVNPPTVQTPEPTTILAWGLVAGGGAWRLRRRLRPSGPI